MRMETNAQLNMEQKLHMTPEVQLSLQVLQMSSIELSAFLQNEFLENPAIALEEREVARPEPEFENARGFLDYLNTPGCRKAAVLPGDDEIPFIERIGEETSSLDELESVVNCLHIKEEVRVICRWMLLSLDERGYLTESDEAIAKRFQVPMERVQEAREAVKSLPPYGLGACSLKDCLVTQLMHRGLLTDLHQELIENHLENLAENRIRVVAKEMGLSVEKVQELMTEICGLEPKPARAFRNRVEEIPRPPDGFVHVRDGVLEVTVNHECIPRLRLDESFLELLKAPQDKTVEQYLNERVNRALLVMKHVDQRKNTLGQVIEAIAEAQEDYFQMKTSFLRPLTRKEIAEKVGVHESTVSRAVRDKYVCSNRGTFQLGDLFDNQVGDSSNASSGKIKTEIQRIIEEEDKQQPISDQRITELLHVCGLAVKRRTVAKYREELGIRSSSRRRQLG